jgi:Tfp pilus assembly protein PilF
MSQMKNCAARWKWILAASCAPLLLSGCAPKVIPTSSAPNAALNPTLSRRAPISLRREAALPPVAAIPVEDPLDVAAIKRAQDEAAQWVERGLKTAVKPTDSGEGLVVCEPVLQTKASTPTARHWNDFGAGCARWLQLQAAGQGELGKTPLWSTMADAQKELKLPNLRLSDKDARRVALQAAATRTAAGTLQANGERGTLTYRVLDARTGRARGKCLMVSGTQNEIVAQLPQLARAITRQLDVKPPTIETVVGANVADLEFLGHLPRQSSHDFWEGELRPADEARLRRLSSRVSLAGVLWMYNEARDQDEKTFWRAVVHDLVAHSAQNATVMASLAWKSPEYIAPYARQWSTLLQRFPNNFGLELSQAHLRAEKNDADAEMRAASRAVAASPKSDLAWRKLGLSFNDKANSVRHNRYMRDMTPEERRLVSSYYPYDLQAQLQATRLNPRSSANWHAACTAAAFSSSAISRPLYWKALRTDPEDLDVYHWGLQMFQPKWGGNADDLKHLVGIARTHSLIFVNLTRQIGEAYDASGLSREFPPVVQHTIALLQEEIARHPQHARPHETLAYILRNNNEYSKAEAEFQKCLKLQPDNVVPLVNLGVMYSDKMHNDKAARAQYEQVLKIDPNNAVAAANIGTYYKDIEHNFERSAPYFRRAMQADPNYVQPVAYLADLYWFLKNDEKTGGKLFVQATKMSSNDGLANAEYAWALMRHNKREQAMVEAQKALTLGYTSHPVFKALGLRSQ